MIEEIIGIEKFDNTKVLSDTNDKSPDEITLKKVVILLAFVITNDGKFYPQLFLKFALYDK